MIWISVKILFLLWAINFAPPLMAHILDKHWKTPLDRGLTLSDGKPLFGPHKTVRGIVAAVVTGTGLGVLQGFPWWIGFLTALLSMSGDLLSSFLKRRWDLPSGGMAPGLDQFFEGTLPFLVLAPCFSLSTWLVVWLVLLFSTGALMGSWFLKRVLSTKPYEDYPRTVHPRVRLREWRACKLEFSPLAYFLNFERALVYHIFMKSVFVFLGIYKAGERNALEIERRDLTFYFPDLPPAFDEYTILFLTDLHLDGLAGLTERVKGIVKDLRVDLCILGGDFRMETFGPFSTALSHLRRILPEIHANDGIYGVLGNHDCLEIIEPLRELDVQFLVNEAKAITRGEERLWIVGVDDPHYYKCHDLREAFEDVPRGAFSILAVHSPEIYREATLYGARFYLCGHTHAGQIQIPSFGPVFTHSRTPRPLCHGYWEYRGMLGYTTSGVGVSGVPVRFFSRGEVVHITLKRGPALPASTTRPR